MKQTRLDKDFGFKAPVSKKPDMEVDPLEVALERPIEYFDCTCGCHGKYEDCMDCEDCECCKKMRCRDCGFGAVECHKCKREFEYGSLASHPFDSRDQKKYCSSCIQEFFDKAGFCQCFECGLNADPDKMFEFHGEMFCCFCTIEIANKIKKGANVLY